MGLLWTARRIATGRLSALDATVSGAALLASGYAQAFALDFTDTFYQPTTGFYGSAYIKDTGTPANNYNSSPTKTADSLLTYTAPSLKMTMGPSGTLRFGAQNLCPYSETISSWSETGVTTAVTDAAVQSGAVSLSEIEETLTTSGNHGRNITVSGLVTGASYAFAFYAKYSDLQYAQINVNSVLSYVDLTDGTIPTNNHALVASDAGAGVWKFSGAFTATGTSTVIYFLPTTTTATSAHAGVIGAKTYVGGVHLRRTPSDDSYLATTSASRIALPLEWDSEGNPLGLLEEEARTNLLTYSRALTVANGWNNVGSGADGFALFSADAATSLTGETDAGAFLEVNAGTNNKQISKSGLTFTAAAHSWSVYVKPVSRTWCKLQAFDGVTFPHAYFDVVNGTVGTTANGGSGTIEALPNGWYRCTLTATMASTASGIVYFEGATSDGGASTYTGETGKGYYVDFAQLEVGAFVTSPIPTIGSTVTRAAENITKATSGFPFSATAGTLYVSVDYGRGANAMAAALGPVASGSNLDFDLRDAAPRIGWWASTLSLTDWLSGGDNKVAASFNSSGDLSAATNGGTVGTTASSDWDGSSTSLTIGHRGGSLQLNGHIKQLLYVPERLSNAALQALTGA